ncbi:MAG: hypothetical protein ACI815_001144 [Psychroserpens sp.]|jgi:hypothetical protein
MHKGEKFNGKSLKLIYEFFNFKKLKIEAWAKVISNLKKVKFRTTPMGPGENVKSKNDLP